MATQEQKTELLEKISLLVTNKFGGDFLRAFAHYDRGTRDGRIDKAELIELLKDADIGNWITRGSWAAGIIAQLDQDRDGAVSRAEFQVVLRLKET